MNFISMIKQEEVAMELKYCERCGGLWLRPQGGDGVYCPGCYLRMAALPRPTMRPRPGPRLPRGEGLQSQARIDVLLGVAEAGVQA
jgi:DNA-directed RNA polymerase subunit RPC12/RpoP